MTDEEKAADDAREEAFMRETKFFAKIYMEHWDEMIPKQRLKFQKEMDKDYEPIA